MHYSTYKVEFTDAVARIMANGKSAVHVCAELKISKKTFYKWCKEHPEFDEAHEIGRSASEAFWQDLGQEGMQKGNGFNAKLYALQMVNRFGWRSKDPEEAAAQHTAAVTAAMHAVQLAAQLRADAK